MIKIVTDSTADIPHELCERYNIEVVPLYINFGDKTYKENVDISKDEFYQKLREFEPRLPTTSQPTPQDFIDIYNKIKENIIISIHISSKLSGTCESANMAKKSIQKDITIIDSKMVSAGLGLLVLYAAKAVKLGKNKEEILELINQLKQNITIYFTVESLKYLEKGGRIGKTQALLGSILHIIPILSFKEGIIVPIEKIRGSKKVLPKYIALINNKVGKTAIDVFMIHAACPDKITQLEEMLKTNFNCQEIITSMIGGVVGTHAGPGTWGLAFYSSLSL